jgi:hypothetical protein
VTSNVLASTVILLACLSLGQTAFGQKQSPSFIPLPKDIDCSLLRTSFSAHADQNGKMVVSGSVGKFVCWIIEKGNKGKKQVPLASNMISHGMLPTKDFGSIVIEMSSVIDGGSDSPALRLLIHRDKVPLLRDFLQK